MSPVPRTTYTKHSLLHLLALFHWYASWGRQSHVRLNIHFAPLFALFHGRPRGVHVRLNIHFCPSVRLVPSGVLWSRSSIPDLCSARNLEDQERRTSERLPDTNVLFHLQLSCLTLPLTPIGYRSQGSRRSDIPATEVKSAVY